MLGSSYNPIIPLLQGGGSSWCIPVRSPTWLSWPVSVYLAEDVLDAFQVLAGAWPKKGCGFKVL